MFVKRTLDKDKNSKIRIVGVNDLGNVIIDNFYNMDYHRIVITPNMSDAYGIPDTKLIIGYNINNGLPIGNNVKLSQDIFDESRKEIENLLINYSEYIADDNIVFIGGVGDTLSSIVLPSIIELNKEVTDRAKDIHRKTFVIVSTPFKFEGNENNDRASSTIAKLKELEENHFIDSLIIVNADNFFDDSIDIAKNYNRLIEEVCKEVYNIIETL